MAEFSEQTVRIRRRALSRQFRATMDRIRAIQESDLYMEPEVPFLEPKELKAVETVKDALDKLERHLGVVARRLEQ